ncbi:Rho termination factor N-terminal domain-containing protein [Streptomyces cucumeris]|uniref:Rho termination factor N-terminal domain-containing protein n=1 Tax=Streptomyces TaxID=1883 RepID=UPI0020C8E781|nr:Rho termination factor N-terminal domain-containing protein [Streptomyces sp. NEAU-Y11]MCP9207952.1 Rho termination factor N-terminal domain-containing protein [Streptomyces sp. NEAU-Y11]
MPKTTMKSSKSSSRRTSMPRRGAKGGTMESQTKEELYRKAKKAGIEGRSQMSKSELISALRHR